MRDAIPGSLSRLSTSPAYVPFTGVIGFGLLAGARRGKDDRWPAPDAVPERRRDPIATCGRSIDIVAVVRTKRCKMAGGLREECDRGSAMADRPGNHRPSPHPRRTPLDNWSMSRADGHAKWRAAVGSLAPWCTCWNAGWEHNGGMQSQTGPRVREIHRPATGPSQTIGRHFSDLSCFL